MQQSLLDKENYFKIFERFESANGSCNFYAPLAQLVEQRTCGVSVMATLAGPLMLGETMVRFHHSAPVMRRLLVQVRHGAPSRVRT